MEHTDVVMAFSLADIVSACAATLTTASFLPQAIKVIQTRDTQAISFIMYLMFTLGVIAWEAYGLMTGQWSIIIANLVTGALASLILCLKVRDMVASRRMPRA
jgi:MtN3 and saliva related transmembrane protein